MPLSEDQHDRVQAEKEIYNGMSITKRRAFRDLQEWVRVSIIFDTDGLEFGPEENSSFELLVYFRNVLT